MAHTDLYVFICVLSVFYLCSICVLSVPNTSCTASSFYCKSCHKHDHTILLAWVNGRSELRTSIYTVTKYWLVCWLGIICLKYVGPYGIIFMTVFTTIPFCVTLEQQCIYIY
jgi:hypothetical protein